jgi:hypothetical protein
VILNYADTEWKLKTKKKLLNVNNCKPSMQEAFLNKPNVKIVVKMIRSVTYVKLEPCNKTKMMGLKLPLNRSFLRLITTEQEFNTRQMSFPKKMQILCRKTLVWLQTKTHVLRSKAIYDKLTVKSSTLMIRISAISKLKLN